MHHTGCWHHLRAHWIHVQACHVTRMSIRPSIHLQVYHVTCIPIGPSINIHVCHVTRMPMRPSIHAQVYHVTRVPIRTSVHMKVCQVIRVPSRSCSFQKQSYRCYILPFETKELLSVMMWWTMSSWKSAHFQTIGNAAKTNPDLNYK